MNKTIISILLLTIAASSTCSQVQAGNLGIPIQVKIGSCLTSAVSVARMLANDPTLSMTDLQVALSSTGACIATIMYDEDTPTLQLSKINFTGILDFWKQHKRCEHSFEV